MAENINPKMQEALKARKKREEVKRRLAEAKKKEEEARERARKKAVERKKAEKAEKELKDERELLIKLADIKAESKSSRIHFAGQGFFDLLNKFDTGEDGEVIKDGPFSKKYNSLNIEDVAKAVIESCKFFPNNGKPNVTIFGNTLEEKLDKLIADREELINKAKEKLDIEWQKMEASEKEKEKETDSVNEEGKAESDEESAQKEKTADADKNE